jgi:Methyltransferase domain
MTPFCRLCGGPARHVFDHCILGRHQVPYFECTACGSIQTERPYWLEEAYAIEGVHIDIGQAARVLQTWLRLCLLLDRICFDRSALCIDYGSSAGLLARLMRDVGYDYRVYDRYDVGKYANYFQIDALAGLQPGLISAFEVFEHFPEPRESLGEILSLKPALVAFSTVFYEGQGRDWGYLVPCCGQHVFFYTQRAIERFADDYGYELRRCLAMWLLLRRGSQYLAALDEAAQPLVLDVAAA